MCIESMNETSQNILLVFLVSILSLIFLRKTFKKIKKPFKTFKTFFCFHRHWSSITVLEVIKPGNWPNPVSQSVRPEPPPPSLCAEMGFHVAISGPIKQISRSAHRKPNFMNPAFQFPQFKVLQSVFPLFHIKSYIGIFGCILILT